MGEAKKFYDRFSVIDIVVMAIIAAIFGAIGVCNQLITDSLRMVFGLYGGMIVGGIFQTPGIMAYGLIRKKGVALITQNLFGIAQVLYGNPIGFLVLWFSGIGSVGMELTFLLFRYRRADDWRVWALAGMVTMLFSQIPNYVIYGFGKMAWWSWLLPLILIALPSSALFPVLLTKAAVKIIPSSWIRRA